MKKIIFFIIVLISQSIYSQSMDNMKTPLIPMKDFFKNPEKTRFRISPNGQYLSYLAPYESRLNIFVQKVGSKEAIRVTSAKERDIIIYFWESNDRIVFLNDKGGDENFRLYSVKSDGTDEKDLTPFEKVRVEVLDDLEDLPGEMLIMMNKENPQVFEVYHINIVTGDMNVVAKNPGNITGWLTDNDGKVRIAITTDGVNNTIMYRKTEAEEFKPVTTLSFKESLSPLVFSADNSKVFAFSNLNRDKIALIEYDIENNKELKEIYINNEVDLGGLNYSRKQKKILAVSYTKDKVEYHFLDDEFGENFSKLIKKFPDREVAIASMNKDEDKWIVTTTSDVIRGIIYFYDVKKDELKELANVAPWLKSENLVKMKPVTYKSRDGLSIPAYLTLPKDVDEKNLPVVVNPHGGPWFRDEWGYNPEVQFLANRGYAVLQMNFRGSTGYGRKFWEASFKEWGKKMQDDISDGVKWLISEGIADPNRVGIYGGSYGGYATLSGLTFTPDLYACGVDYVGVSNLFTFMKTIPPYWKPYLDMLYEMVGSPEKDSTLLHSASPVFHVDKIKAPLFIAQGANDPRVNKAESDQMVEALRKKGIDVPYLVKDNEGHGFLLEENRFDFYRQMETFLAKYLKGRSEKEPEL